MEIVNLIQGSKEWHDHRAKFKNASDAPAMMGESPYETRTELLHRLHTGINKPVDPVLQKRFDDGHAAEALARPVAENIVGEPLYPVVGVNGKYSASFDGLTMGEDVGYEHKSLNDEIRACFENGHLIKPLPSLYQIQMEHQAMVGNLIKVLFMATKWKGETLLEKVECWYEPDLEFRQRIIDGWAQLDIDLANYVPVEVIEAPKPQAIMALPSLAIQIKGEVTLSNLPEFKAAATAFIANIKTELITDEDFSYGDAMAKFCKDAEDNIELTKAAAIAQTSSIDELMRTLDFIKNQLRTKRLELEKAVKTQKEQIRTNAIMKGKSDFAEHLATAEKEISPIRLQVPVPDFATAISGVKTIKSLHSKIGDALANGKIIIDAAARDIRAKQAWLKENADGYQFLFNDIQTIIHKPMDDLQILAKSRIAEHKAIEAEREEEIKADAEAKRAAELEAAKEKASAPEVQEQAPSSPEFAGVDLAQPGSEVTATTHHIGEASKSQVTQTQYFAGAVPTANELVCILAEAMHVDETLAHKWLCETDFMQYKKAA